MPGDQLWNRSSCLRCNGLPCLQAVRLKDNDDTSTGDGCEAERRTVPSWAVSLSVPSPGVEARWSQPSSHSIRRKSHTSCPAPPSMIPLGSVQYDMGCRTPYAPRPRQRRSHCCTLRQPPVCRTSSRALHAPLVRPVRSARLRMLCLPCSRIALKMSMLLAHNPIVSVRALKGG